MMHGSLLLVGAAVAAAPSVLDLQRERVEVNTPAGVRVVDLQPSQGRWLLVEAGGQVSHLENPAPALISVDVAASDDAGRVLVDPGGTTRCAPWAGAPSELARAASSLDAYVPVCGGHLLVRNIMKGRKTALEWSVDLVRDRWSGGERLTEVVKETVYKDRFLETAKVGRGGATVKTATGRATPPPSVALLPTAADATLSAPELGLPVVGAPPQLPAGRYLPLAVEGAWVAAVTSGAVAPAGDRGPKSPLDGKENSALVVLVAFDLSRFDVDYELGTEHPKVGWSDRFPTERRPPGRLGPDGFDTVAPLARTGQVPPTEIDALVATFTAGFKRQHGAFRSGPMAGRNLGSHYGFVQDGVVLSTPQPGLATLLVDPTGEVDIRAWTDADVGTATTWRHIRQNGVPIVVWDEEAAAARAGALVDQWSAGNWSGSAEGQLRSLRAGACIVEDADRRYLVYGWFSAATPAGMARVFLAAGCRGAMLLDMNALEHTYLALYGRGPDGALLPHHLDRGMAVLDKTAKGGAAMPRFVAFPDNRDFFVVRRKAVAP